jgi:hypothetical protein
MQFEGTVLTQQGVTFALMVVKEHVLDNPSQRDQVLHGATMFFKLPTVLVSDRRHRTFGRDDIVRFLRNVNITQIPWRRYTVSG